MITTSNWIAVTESQFDWEREALEFIRARFPRSDPYRAWANFEFIAGDGSINEVDLLVFTPQGFFLIEIKSRPGKIVGNQSTWTWETNGRPKTYDNPLLATNRKAKRLKSLLERQRAFKHTGKVPFIEALVFCSDPQQQLGLPWDARMRVCLRDRPPTPDTPGRPGIMAAILNRQCEGLEPQPRDLHNRPISKLIAQALEQAGIQPSLRSRRVNDYLLDQPMEGEDGPGYQDWLAHHVQIEHTQRRIRFYLARQEASQADKAMVDRAAEREFQILETLQHPRILRCYGLSAHELGPALLLEHHPTAIRLDHYLTQQQDNLSIDTRLDLMRQIAEAIAFVHEQRVIHGGLSPRAILVTQPRQSQHPEIKLLNWQLGYRAGSNTASPEVTATSHADQLIDDASAAYIAPEGLIADKIVGEGLDIFSLGAIAFHLFSGSPPATNALTLEQQLRKTKGLQISAVMNGAPEALQDLIKESTRPDVDDRLESVADFLSGLDLVEEALTAAEATTVENPSDAKKGDRLPGNLEVLKRLGQGASAVGYWVKRDDQDFVLKVANDPDHNNRLRDEADALGHLRHPNIVELLDVVEVGSRVGLLMKPITVNRKNETHIETLGQRLRKEGQLHLDLLQRFGEELLSALCHLEDQGINHRDIKPDNIAIGQGGKADRLHIVLFDFSLTKTPVDNFRAGTPGYLDPLLSLRKPSRWDLQAERYSAAVTLYQMATNTLPTWGDGKSDPSYLECEITLEPERFETTLRAGLTDFFRQAFKRQPDQRFDNGEEMLKAWRACFEAIDAPGTLLTDDHESALEDRLGQANFDTTIQALGLGARATDALDSENLLTVRELLLAPPGWLHRLRGVSHPTRREIRKVVNHLRQRLGVPSEPDTGGDTHQFSLDRLLQDIAKPPSREEPALGAVQTALLGLHPKLTTPWPGQIDLVAQLQLPPEQVTALMQKLQRRWARTPAITQLRHDVVDWLQQSGGIMADQELATALLVARGSVQDEPLRSRHAHAVLRAAIEVEQGLTSPRFYLRRTGSRMLLALNPNFLNYGQRLGEIADDLAIADPLIAPDRALEQLRAVAPPPTLPPLSDSQLLRLAAAAAQQAELSSRLEFYPRNMAAERALRLAQGALYGVASLTVQQIKERVASRYPKAAPLPERPALDQQIQAIIPNLVWNPNQGQGAYINRAQDWITISSSSSLSRLSTAPGQTTLAQVTPDIATARQLEEKLQRSLQDGAFLALLVNPQHYQQARQELTERFALQLVDYEALFLDCLRQVADEARVVWDKVVAADAMPNSGDWDKLLRLVGRAMPRVEAALGQSAQTILLIYPGLLARYHQLTLLERLREQVGRPDGIPGLWVLIPNDQQATIDGQPVPLLSPGQRARLTQSWLNNRHRAAPPTPLAQPPQS